MSEWSVPLDELPLSVLLVADGRIHAATTHAVALLGESPELEGRSVVELFRAEDHDAVAALVEQSGGRRLVARLDRPDLLPIELTVSGPPGRQVVALRDVRLERRLSAIIDAVADSTLLLDPDGRLMWQSESLVARLPKGEANLGTQPVERIHPEDLPMILESFAGLDQRPMGRASHVVRSRSVERDDVWQLIELLGASRIDQPDLAGVVVQVRNLDEGTEVESLARTDGPLLSLAEAAPIGIVLMDAQKRTVFANRVSRELLGLPEAPSAELWRERITGWHQDRLDRLFDAGLAGEEVSASTVPIETPAGGSGWLRVRAVAHHDARRDVVGLIVSLEDITAEVAARVESERLLQMLDVTSDFVLIIRSDGEILHTNAAMQALLDRVWTEEGRGRLVDLLGMEARDRWLADALGAVEHADTWQGELTLRTGGGDTLPVSALAVVGRDERGEIDWIAMVARDITGMKEAEDRFRHMATLDHLTGLANRALFTEELDNAVVRSRSSGRAVAVLFCDLDRFKEVNDRLGHAAGDEVLARIADRLREIIRDDDVAARVGGDEFVVLCEGLTDVEALAGLAERVIGLVQQPIDVAGDQVQVGISIGVAVARAGGVEADRLLIAADQAMYRAKATGGNRYRISELDRS
jgi:diguanylate cyclase (GGDEF)-like protein